MSKSNREALQRFINSNLPAQAARLEVDGAVGTETRGQLWALFGGAQTPATPAEIAMVANALGAAPEQVRAVAAVESSGGGFLKSGHPKILWERHWFWRRLKVKIGSALPGQWIAHPNPGGYTLDADKDGVNDSWEKLLEACGHNPVAAFESCSWGKFQIMGGHWKALGYASVFDFAFAMVGGEAGHYRALAAFIKANRLEKALRALGTSPLSCEAFARGYNGAGFRKHEYHIKLARAMRREVAA